MSTPLLDKWKIEIVVANGRYCLSNPEFLISDAKDKLIQRFNVQDLVTLFSDVATLKKEYTRTTK